MGFDERHYVPTLKWKQGEQKALKEIDPALKERFTPLIEITPIPLDPDTDIPVKSIDDHLARTPQQLVASWGTQYRFFLDLDYVDGNMASGRHPVDELFDLCANQGLIAVPVTSIPRDAAFQAAVKTVVSRDGRGVCVRIDTDELVALVAGNAALSTLLTTLGTTPPDVDLVVDLGDVSTQTNQALVATALAGYLNNIPTLMTYRTLTLLAGAFPVNLSGVSQGIGSVPRLDWLLWQAVQATALPLTRVPTFGDYAISHPDVPDDIDPRVMKASASIRYTTRQEWLIPKARNVRDYGFGQFNTLSAALVRHPAFSGAQFSAGDKFIDQCANGGSTGNLATWRFVGTNHHITFVVRQIASLHGTSGSGGQGPGAPQSGGSQQGGGTAQA